MAQQYNRVSDAPYGKIIVHTLNVIIPAAIIALVGIGYSTRINSANIDNLINSQIIQDGIISRMNDKIQDMQRYNSASERDFDYLQRQISECRADLKQMSKASK